MQISLMSPQVPDDSRFYNILPLERKYYCENCYDKSFEIKRLQ